MYGWIQRSWHGARERERGHLTGEFWVILLTVEPLPRLRHSSQPVECQSADGAPGDGWRCSAAPWLTVLCTKDSEAVPVLGCSVIGSYWNVLDSVLMKWTFIPSQPQPELNNISFISQVFWCHGEVVVGWGGGGAGSLGSLGLW